MFGDDTRVHNRLRTEARKLETSVFGKLCMITVMLPS